MVVALQLKMTQAKESERGAEELNLRICRTTSFRLNYKCIPNSVKHHRALPFKSL